MANLKKLQEFAEKNNFDLTAPLKHSQILQLAGYWMPEMRFYYEEQFHPISLDEFISIISSNPDSQNPEFRVPIITGIVELQPPYSPYSRYDNIVGYHRPTTNWQFVFSSFSPPVVYQPGDAPSFKSIVLNEDISILEALEHPYVNDDTILTNGDFDTYSHFFASQDKLQADYLPAAPENPYLPRAKSTDKTPLITIYAQYKNLLDVLEFDLKAEEARDQNSPTYFPEYPLDALRGGFIITDLLHSGELTTWDVRRQCLLNMIAAYKAGEDIMTVIPEGWKLNDKSWTAITSYAFLEYYFFYAYDDYFRYNLWPILGNKHEGDDEGCCFVFDRKVVENAAKSSDPNALMHVCPHSIITLVHRESDNTDEMKFIPTHTKESDDPRKVVQAVVYIAAGSHATFLTEGIHDNITFDSTEQYWPWIAVIAAAGLMPIAAILAAIFSCAYGNPEDKTSDDGVRIVPEASEYPGTVDHSIIVVPMSGDNHIYKTEHEDLLRLVSYPGQWGESTFKPKTRRYFNRLLTIL